PSDRSWTSSDVHFVPIRSAHAATAQVVASWISRMRLSDNLPPSVDGPAAEKAAGPKVSSGRDLRLVPRLRHDPDVRLRLLPLAEDLLGLVVGDGAGDDHVVALLPVDGGRDLVLRGQLERIDHAQDLVEVAAGRHRVDEDQLDLLVRTDHEHVPDGLV